jgi:L-fuculose-phosphate aldolase
MDDVDKLVRYTRLAWDRGLSEGMGGNMSVRRGQTVHITPTGRVKHFLTRDDLVELDLNGGQVSTGNRASSEYRMHLVCYRLCPEIRAVFHAHPVFATAMAVTGKPIPENVLPESALMLAPITYLPYQTPGTAEFAEAFSAGLKGGSRTFVLQNHGVSVAAESVEQAFAGLETLEFVARISYLTGAAPGHLEIDAQAIKALLERERGKP